MTVVDLMIGVNIALGRAPIDQCTSIDRDGDGRVAVYELLSAVRRSLGGCPYRRDNTLRLNQVQVVGTHNSYHLQADPPVLAAIISFSEVVAEQLEYSHPPLPEQFDAEAVRQIEIDVFADPNGGLFASPVGLQLETGDPTAHFPELEAPGLKVLHLQDIDYRSNCSTFTDCLQTVKAWSDAHPLHMPIMILIEAKDDVIPNLLGYHFVVPVPFGPAELDGIDAEIRAVFPPGQLITPDDVRGNHATLREAILTDGWPTLGASRGKVLFCLDNASRRELYLQGHPSLQGRVLFTNATEDVDDAGFIEYNDSIGNFADIQKAVGDGFVVRTRSDADTEEARANDTTARDMAIASGAQWVSTDYPVPDPAIGTGFQVTMPGGTPARCNPISAPADCTSADIETPAHLSDDLGD